MIKSRRMRWAGHVAQMGEKRNVCRISFNEALHNLYSLPSLTRMMKSRRMRWAGHIAQMGAKRNVCRILVGRPEGKRPLRRPNQRWVSNMH
jgi:hypothetical protein